MGNFLNEYIRWKENSDEETKKELEEIKENELEIKERFYKCLKFETAGLRGIIGSGTNRMNKYIVAQATQGLANVIKKSKEEACVAIAYDSRIKSREFAEASASVLAANNIKVYIFENICPVPVLSFAVRELSCTAGIVITASHNPSKYNGFKVYSRDGAQVGINDANLILDEISKIDVFNDILFANEQQQKLINYIGNEVYEKYYNKLLEQSINPELFEKNFSTKIVYTPLHGSGNKFVQEIFKKLRFQNLIIVKEQEEPDGNFPTVECPNPECIESFKLAIEYAKKSNADLIIATDPDCDRVGIALKDKNGDYVTLNGNQIGILLTEYILSERFRNKTLPGDAFIIKSIVSTNMVKKIAEFYDVEVKETLTGFKFIGGLIHESEKSGEGSYVFGFEESFGYLAGTHARDKDGVVASMLIAEMFLYNVGKSINLFDKLKEIYDKFGYYLENTTAVIMEGLSGLEKILEIMKNFRQKLPKEIAGKAVVAIRDYETGVRITVDKEKSDLLLPQSNVLYFELDGENTFIVRPSGTEPKIKFYSLIRGKTKEEAEKIIKNFDNYIKEICNK